MTPPQQLEPTKTAIHAENVDVLLSRLETSRDGLTAEEARRRKSLIGPNRLTRQKQRSAWSILIDQFRSVVVLLLLAAAAVAWLIGDEVEALAILAVLVINTGLGFWTEIRARTAIAGLLEFETPLAQVLRDGAAQSVASEDLVPGDVVELSEGAAVPADARLLQGQDLQTDEAPLTGESTPVDKDATAQLPAQMPLPARSTLVFKGTSVVRGSGTAVVHATGDDTELGRIGRLLHTVEEGSTPLEVRLDRLGRRLIWITLVVAAVVTALGQLRGYGWLYALETGVALAIAAVPEGLPAVATIALAVGVSRMARRNALVRRLPAVETLGSTTVVCTDKTGTLTAGRMTVTRVVTHGADLEADSLTDAAVGAGQDAASSWQAVGLEALEAGALAGSARVERLGDGEWESVGDPMEAALQIAADRSGLGLRSELLQRAPERDRIAFTSQRRWMATLNGGDEALRLNVKGAPAPVLAACTKARTPEGDLELDDAGRERLLQRNREMARGGLRVLAIARGDRGVRLSDPLEDLTFLGFVGLLDPPAEGVAEALSAFTRAGIRTLMITGDQPETAVAVARDLGLSARPEEILGGEELEALDPAELRARVSRLQILSQVSPEEKLHVVDALRDGGEVVAMLGDGVNDAPALRRAHVGVAMGKRGTDVAKEAASVVLQDDRFSTVAVAVEGGRVIFDNIRRFVFYLFSCNLAEVLVLLIAGIVGLPQPLRPLQILWLNLVTDTFPALALALEPAEEGVMHRPPRDPDSPLLDKHALSSIFGYAALMSVATLLAFWLGLGDGDLDHAITLAFATLAFVQLFHLGNARNRGPVWAPRKVVSNPWALGSVGLVVGLQVAAIHFAPLASLLGLVPLSIQDWGLVVVLSATPAVLAQTGKWMRARTA